MSRQFIAVAVTAILTFGAAGAACAADDARLEGTAAPAIDMDAGQAPGVASTMPALWVGGVLLEQETAVADRAAQRQLERDVFRRLAAPRS